ncbi:MAG: hypothetical protein ACRD25_10845 [Terracidiphilus sp.]
MLGRSMPLAIIVPLWALLGYVVILDVRWLRRDCKKQQAAHEAELQNLAEGGKTYSPLPLTGVNKFWRWLLNGYAVVLIAALAYAVIRYFVDPR